MLHIGNNEFGEGIAIGSLIPRLLPVLRWVIVTVVTAYAGQAGKEAMNQYIERHFKHRGRSL